MFITIYLVFFLSSFFFSFQYSLALFTMPQPIASFSSNRPIAIFSDFDGTIFLQDTGHILFDHHGCGPERRAFLDESISTGENTFRKASLELWQSLRVPLDTAFATLKEHLVVDPGFHDFLNNFAFHRRIPFVVISAGLRPLLRRVLDESVGKAKLRSIEIVSNDGVISADGANWTPVWLHDTELTHDKARSIREYRVRHAKANPLIVFIGDGVSDLAGASQADVLFARRGLKLEQYCIKNRIPYTPYDSFTDIQRELEVLVVSNRFHSAAQTPAEAAADGPVKAML